MSDNEANIWQPRTILSASADSKRVTQSFVATAGQLAFTITDFAYALNTGSLEVFHNGLALSPVVGFSEVSGTAFNISVAAVAGDTVLAVGYVAITGSVPPPLLGAEEESITLTSGQTLVTLTTLDTVNTIYYVSGVGVDKGRLALGLDYTVSSSSAITLTNSFPAGAVITATQGDANPISSPATGITYDNTSSGLTAAEMQAATDELAASIALINKVRTVITSATTLAIGDKVAANSTAGVFTITLPLTPSAGDKVFIMDYLRTWGTNNVTLARNGENIEHLAEDHILNVNNAPGDLEFIDSTAGWKLT